MIKVKVIEKEEKIKEPKQILLEDCKLNDFVELQDGTTAVVIGHTNSVKDEYRAGDKCLALVEDNDFWVGGSFAQQAIEGKGGSSIKRIIGTLTGIEVTAK